MVNVLSVFIVCLLCSGILREKEREIKMECSWYSSTRKFSLFHYSTSYIPIPKCHYQVIIHYYYFHLPKLRAITYAIILNKKKSRYCFSIIPCRLLTNDWRLKRPGVLPKVAYLSTCLSCTLALKADLLLDLILEAIPPAQVWSALTAFGLTKVPKQGHHGWACARIDIKSFICKLFTGVLSPIPDIPA